MTSIFYLFFPGKMGSIDFSGIKLFASNVKALTENEDIDSQSVIASETGQRLSRLDKDSLHLLHSKLVEHFSSSDDVFANVRRPLSLKQKIELRRTLRQKSNESVKAFYDRCCAAQLKLGDDKQSRPSYERDTTLNFVVGLKSEVQNKVRQYHGHDLGSYLLAAEQTELEIKELKDLASDIFTVKKEEGEVEDEADAQIGFAPEPFEEDDSNDIMDSSGGDFYPVEKLEIKQENENDEPSILSEDTIQTLNKKPSRFECNVCHRVYESAKLVKAHHLGEQRDGRRPWMSMSRDTMTKWPCVFAMSVARALPPRVLTKSIY